MSDLPGAIAALLQQWDAEVVQLEANARHQEGMGGTEDTQAWLYESLAEQLKEKGRELRRLLDE